MTPKPYPYPYPYPLLKPYVLIACSSRPIPILKPLYQFPLPSVPGKTLTALLVTFPPNGSTPPHRHGQALLTGYVIEGTSNNKMNDQPTTVVKAGDSWFEAPGCHHKVSDNASKTEKLVLIATFVIDTDVLEKEGQAALVQIDEEYREGFGEALKKQQQQQ